VFAFEKHSTPGAGYTGAVSLKCSFCVQHWIDIFVCLDLRGSAPPLLHITTLTTACNKLRAWWVHSIDHPRRAATARRPSYVCSTKLDRRPGLLTTRSTCHGEIFLVQSSGQSPEGSALVFLDRPLPEFLYYSEYYRRKEASTPKSITICQVLSIHTGL